MRTILTLAACLALAIPAGADHCTTYSTASPEITLDPAPGVASRYYWDNDWCQPGCSIFSFWIYEESNGIDGLQRGDEWVDDTCHGMIAADRLIF